MPTISEARKAAGLTAVEVSHAVNRPSQWLSEVESGRASMSADHERIVLTAIARLERFAQTVKAANEKLCSDLHLPPTCTVTKPRPAGHSRPLST